MLMFRNPRVRGVALVAVASLVAFSGLVSPALAGSYRDKHGNVGTIT